MRTLLELRKVRKYFSTGTLLSRHHKQIKAVDGIDLSIQRNETVALVGESGCGKTTTALLILRLLQPTDGFIIYKGSDVAKKSGKDLRKYRREVQMVFQNPQASLNRRKSLRQIISLPLRVNHMVDSKKELGDRICNLLELVNLRPPDEFLNRHPHELSAGQRQRVGIARAISLEPDLIVLDEPTASLDVSIRTQILTLLRHLQTRFDISYLYITHDLGLIRSFSDRVAVMYLGKIVELAKTQDLFTNPLHPYTEALIQAVPVPDPRKARSTESVPLLGEVPSPINPPQGCAFHPRCKYAVGRCKNMEPKLLESEKYHHLACHLRT